MADTELRIVQMTEAIKNLTSEVAQIRQAVLGNGNTQGSLVSRVADNAASIRTSIRWGIAIAGIAGVAFGVILNTVLKHMGG